LVKDVLEANLVQGRLFSLTYRKATGERKKVDYEASSSQGAKQIVGKLKYLKGNI
jgi:hypothetical protein